MHGKSVRVYAMGVHLPVCVHVPVARNVRLDSILLVVTSNLVCVHTSGRNARETYVYEDTKHSTNMHILEIRAEDLCLD